MRPGSSTVVEVVWITMVRCWARTPERGVIVVRPRRRPATL